MQIKGIVGIPNIIWYGVEGEHNVLVMDLLGASLEELFSCCKRKFSLKTVLILADQMVNKYNKVGQIQRVEYFHSKQFLHRDIKPDNFVIGLGKKQWLIHIIDYGLAKRYMDPRTGTHIKYRDKKDLTGTARYTSINTHLGIEQSRRDDLEGIGYVLMYFNRGSLPWQGLHAKTKKEKYDRIRDVKISTPVETLCKDFPDEFATYIKYCRKLNFEDEPDYNYVKKLFKDLFTQQQFALDYIYDWVILKRKAKIAALIGNPITIPQKLGKIMQRKQENEKKKRRHYQ